MRTIARVWNMGEQQDTVVPDRQGCVELVLPDGRTVQMTLDFNGHLTIRAWAAEPLITGNAHALHVTADIPTLEQMVCEDAEVEAPRVSMCRISASDVISPNRDMETWVIADAADRRRATDVLDRAAQSAP